jgi:hypothetical protein
MPKVLVLHHSTYGPIEAMAQAAVDLVQLHPATRFRSESGAYAGYDAYRLTGFA